MQPGERPNGRELNEGVRRLFGIEFARKEQERETATRTTTHEKTEK